MVDSVPISRDQLIGEERMDDTFASAQFLLYERPGLKQTLLSVYI